MSAQLSEQPADAEPRRETLAPLKVRAHTRADDAGWNAYAEAHPGYTIYHGRAFHDAVAEAFGMASHGLIAENDCDEIIGILPLVRQRSRLFGDRLVSLPYANHGGPLADSHEVALALFEAAGKIRRELRCNQIEVRDHVARELDWPVHTDKVLMTRTLPVTIEALGQELGAKLRSQCRRALKDGAEADHGGAELIAEFYEVFAVNMRDLGTPVYPRRWFDVLSRHLGQAMHLVVVRLEGRPVAGCVLLKWKETLEIPWAASLREFNRHSVNMLLYREAMDFAVRAGCRRFDFGRSTRGSGPHKFKQQWGGEESPIYWRTIPAGRGKGQASAILRERWKRLPLRIANTLGPMVSAKLPW